MRTILMTAAALLAFPVLAAEPPVAKKVPYEVKAPFGATRTDNYYWLRDDTRKNEEMLAYLRAENAYADAVLADSKPLAETLYKEVTARLAPDDSSVPYLKGGYWYYTRYVAGQDYPVVARRKGEMTAPEEVLLDQNAMAVGKGYFRVGAWTVSPDKSKIAWSEDTVGRGQYSLKVKTIAGGEILDAKVSNIEDIVWSDDNATLYYIDKDPVTLLSKRVKAHMIGSEATTDRLVYEEADDSFYISLGRTTSDKYVCIYLHATVSDEQRCAPAAGGDFAVIAPREREFLYTADHVEGPPHLPGMHYRTSVIVGRWIIRTNWQAKNYRLMQLTDSSALGDRTKWYDVVPHSKDVFIESFQAFDDFVAIEERVGGNKRLRILTDRKVSTPVQSDEPAYVMDLNINPDQRSDWVRYSYGSLTTPETIYETHVKTGERRTLKVQPVPGFDASQYTTERVWATARDGTKIPVSLVYKKGFKKDGTAAVYQIGYGSYGSSSDPAFNPMFPSLLDRGMVVAIAHIRGGQEMGRQWYDDGHLMKKMNSFTDFIDVTRYLVDQKYAAPKRVAGFGRSAGGLLMGGVANMAPQDYGAIVTQVPFVDAVTTMLDASIPLTTNEYEEWGNPEQKPFYDYMMTYSPYDNVTAQAYPPIYVSTGLWDSQVQYYEPTKWVAKLRATKTRDAPLVYRVNMEAGHGGKSGRFRRWEELSEAMAFMMKQLKVE